MPAATPFITPVLLTAVATMVVLLLQVPPGVVLLSVVAEPAQTTGAPPIDAGMAFTVIVLYASQPELAVYVIVITPAVMPVSWPETPVIDPMATLLELHAPPDAALVSVTVEPSQTAPGPPIAGGLAFTVTIRVRIQPLESSV